MVQKQEYDQPLQGLRILIAEDELLIALALEETLRDAGADVRRAATVRCALRDASDQTLSAALLDVRLGRQTTETVADALAEREIPFLFYSGQDLPDTIRDKHPGATLLLKPVGPGAIIDAFRRIGGH